MVWGDCLPACPAGAITFEEREAAAYDAEAVREEERTAERPDGWGGMLPAGPVAGADQAGAGKGAVF